VQHAHYDGVDEFVRSKRKVRIPHHVLGRGFYSVFPREVSKLAPPARESRSFLSLFLFLEIFSDSDSVAVR